MGVADGVYMWKELGIDSGTMSRTLMETAMHLVQAGVEDVVQGKLGLVFRAYALNPTHLVEAQAEDVVQCKLGAAVQWC